MIVVPHAKVVRHNGPAAHKYGLEPQAYPRVDPLVALTTPWPTDAMIWPGDLVGPKGPEDPTPLLCTASLHPLTVEGFHPQITHAFLDYDRPNHAPWPSPAEARAAVDRLPDIWPLNQAMIYTTSAGLRLVWELETPCPVLRYADYFLALASVIQKVTGWTWSDPDTGAGGLDPTGNEWTRVYRAPYVVRDGALTAPTVRWVGFVPFVFNPATVRKPTPLPSAPVDVPDDVPEPAMPDSATWAKIVMAPIAGRYVDALRLGRPLAKEGKRHETMIRVIGSIAGALNTPDPLAIWSVVGRAVVAGAGEAGAPSVSEAWGWVHSVASERAVLAEVKAKAQILPPLVFAGKTYWVLDEARGTYRPPVGSAALCGALETYCPIASAGGIRTDKGKPRTEAEYIADFGKQIERAIVTLGTKGTRFDVSTGTLYEGTGTRVGMVPAYDPDVDAWLTVFCGGNKQVWDWLATIEVLDRPTAALYLEGDPSVGKGLLAGMVAGLFGASAPTSYAAATGGSFNDALTRCPIVFLNEGLQGQAARDGFSSGFKDLIGEDTRALLRKFVDSGTIVGCPRLMINANDGDALRIRERQTSAGIEAIAQRLLHHYVPKRAAQILADLGGRSGTADWIRTADGAPGRAVRHLAFIIDRDRDGALLRSYGKRWLVQGARTAFHEGLALTSGDTLAVLSAVLEALSRGLPSVRQTVDGVLIHVPSITKQWTALLPGVRPMGGAEIAGALTGIGEVVREGRKAHVRVDPRVIAKAAVILAYDDISSDPVASPQGGQ